MSPEIRIILALVRSLLYTWIFTILRVQSVPPPFFPIPRCAAPRRNPFSHLLDHSWRTPIISLYSSSLWRRAEMLISRNVSGGENVENVSSGETEVDSRDKGKKTR